MRVEVRGWSRDHGGTDLFAAPLSEIDPNQEVANYRIGEKYVSPQYRQGVVHSVKISGSAKLNLNGNYQINIIIPRSDIFYLAWIALKTATLEGLTARFAKLGAMFAKPEEDVNKPIERVGGIGNSKNVFHLRRPFQAGL